MEAQTAAVAGTVVVVMAAAAAAAVQGLAEEVEKVVVVQGWAAVVGTAAAATAAAAAAGVGWAAAAGLDWMRGSPPFLQLLPGALARPSAGSSRGFLAILHSASPYAGVVGILLANQDTELTQNQKKKERKQTTQGRDGRTARRHHTGILITQNHSGRKAASRNSWAPAPVFRPLSCVLTHACTGPCTLNTRDQ